MTGEGQVQSRGDVLEAAAYERLVQSITDYAIFMLDAQGRVASWNPGAARIKGYSADEIIGQPFSRFYTSEDLAIGVPERALKEAAESGRFASEGWRRRKDGTRFWAAVVIDPIRNDDGAVIGFAKVTRDLTERRQARLELDRSREALFQAQKMEAVGQLTGGLAHDFNNLLAGISGSLEMMRARLAQGRIAEVERYVAAAQGAASRAAALTHRLLAFARRQPLEPKPVDADRLVAGMEELIRRTLGPGIALETVASEGLWTCLCDPNQLENAILNLAINARDAMPAGGRLTIETCNCLIDEDAGRRRELTPGQYVRIGVSDTGAGIPADILPRVFDPFFTTKPAGKGTGLGLSMIYGFAKQSNGQARIYSEPGRGACVKLYLPRHVGESPAEDGAPRSDAAPRGEAGQTVLIVDDEPTVRMLIADTLSELGYDTIEAGEAVAGLKVLMSDARIDLLISDIGLPGGMDGLQMTERARERRPSLKVLFITGYAENAAIRAGTLPPDAQVISKPFAMEKLASRVKRIVGD